MRTCFRLVLTLASVTIFGCYGTYSGSYELHSAIVGRAVTPQQISELITDSVSEFGFGAEDIGLPPGEGSWLSRMKPIAPELSALDGSHSRITIALGSHPTLIVIRDLSRASETPFMQALKARIESRLAERFGIENLKFSRRPDIFS